MQDKNISNANTATSSRGNLESEAMDRMMVKLWERLAEMYGPRWVSSYGEPGGKAFQTWSRALKDASPDNIKRGLHRCLRRDEQGWPPTLPEFLGMCEAHTHPSHRVALTHEPTYAAPEVAEAAMKRIRQMLEGTGVVCHSGGDARAGRVHGGHA